ncbi:MAG: hypothetical protein WA869_01030 [Alloacidobacterium sp.]|jgi:hypothetical protein
MRFAAFGSKQRDGLAVASRDGHFQDLLDGKAGYPGPLDALIRKDGAAEAAVVYEAWRRVLEIKGIGILRNRVEDE